MNILKWHWHRYFEYLRIEACARKNHDHLVADYAKLRAAYHRRLAQSLKLSRSTPPQSTPPTTSGAAPI